MQRFGVWSHQDGGFWAMGPTKEEAEQALDDFLEADDDLTSEDIYVIPECEDHEEEPAFGCSHCDADDDEECE